MKPKNKKQEKPLVGRGGKREGSGRKKQLSSELKNKVKVYIGAANVLKWNAIKRAYCDDGDTLFTKKLLEFAEKHMELLASYFTGDEPREERCITPEEHCHEDDPNGPPQYFICLRVTFDLHRWFCKLHTHSQLEPSAFIIHLLLLYTRWHDIVEEFRPEIVSKLVQELQGQLLEKKSSVETSTNSVDNATKGPHATGSGVSCLGQETRTQTGRLELNHQQVQTQAEVSQNVETVEYQSHSLMQSHSVISEGPKPMPSSFPQVQGQTFTVQGQTFEGEVQGRTLGSESRAQGDVLGCRQAQGNEIEGHILESGTQVIVNVIPESVPPTQVHSLQSYTLTPSGERQVPHLGKPLNLSTLQSPVLEDNYEVNIVTSVPLNKTHSQPNEIFIPSKQQFHSQHVPDRPLSEPIQIHALNKQMTVEPVRSLKTFKQLEVVERVRNENMNDYSATKVDSKTTRDSDQHFSSEKQLHTQIQNWGSVRQDQQSFSTGRHMLVDVPQDLSSNHAASAHLVSTTHSYETLVLQNTRPLMGNNQSCEPVSSCLSSELRSHAFGHGVNQSQESQTIGIRNSEGPPKITVLDNLHCPPQNQDGQTIIVHCAPQEGVDNHVTSGPVQHNLIQNSNAPITILPADTQLVPGHIVLDISQGSVGGTRLLNVFNYNIHDPLVQPVVSSVSAFHPVQEQPSDSSRNPSKISTLPMSAHQSSQVFVSKTIPVSAHQSSPVFVSQHFQVPETFSQQSRTDSQILYSQRQVQAINDQGQCLDFSQHQAASSKHGYYPATTRQQNLKSSASLEILPNREHHTVAVIDNSSGTPIQRITSAPPQVLPNRQDYQTEVVDNSSGLSVQRIVSAPPQVLSKREHHQTALSAVVDNSTGPYNHQIPSASPQALPYRQPYRKSNPNNQSITATDQTPSAPPQVLSSTEQYRTANVNNGQLITPQQMYTPLQVMGRRETHQTLPGLSHSVTSHTPMQDPVLVMTSREHPQSVPMQNPPVTFPYYPQEICAPLQVFTSREDPKTANISTPSVILHHRQQPTPPDRYNFYAQKNPHISISRSNRSRDKNSNQNIQSALPFHAQQNQDECDHQRDKISASHQTLVTSKHQLPMSRDTIYSREGTGIGQHVVPKFPAPPSDEPEHFLFPHSQGMQGVRSYGISHVKSSRGTRSNTHSDQMGGSDVSVRSHPELHPQQRLLAMGQSEIGARSIISTERSPLPEQTESNNQHLQDVTRPKDDPALQNCDQSRYDRFIETKYRNIGTGLEILATSALGHHSLIQNPLFTERIAANERSHEAGLVYDTKSAPLPAKTKISSGNSGHVVDKFRTVLPTRQALLDAGLATEYAPGVNLPDQSLGVQVPVPHTHIVRHSQPNLSPKSHIPSSLIPSVTMVTNKSDGLDRRKKQMTTQSVKTAHKSQEVTVHDLLVTSPKPLVTQQQTVSLKADKQSLEKQTKENLQTSAASSECEKNSKIFQPPPSCVKLKELLLRRTKSTIPSLFDDDYVSKNVGEQVNQGVDLDRVCPNDDGGGLLDSISQMEQELSDSADDTVMKIAKPKGTKPAKITKRKRSDRSSRSSVSRSTRSTKKKNVEIETVVIPQVGSRRKRHKSNTGFTGEIFAEMPRFQPARASRRKADNKGQNRCLFPDFNAEKPTLPNSKSDVNDTSTEDYIVREKSNEKGKKTKTYECKICHVLRKTVGNMRRHIVAHRKVFKCTCCNTNFSTKNGLFFHKKKKSGNKFDCSLCSFSTYYVPFLRAHMKRSHPEKLEKVFCDVCGKSLKNKASLNSHLLCHKSEEIKEVCSDCGKLFTSVKYLHRHQKRVHSTKDHVCTHQNCDKSFPSKSQLKAHVDRVHLKVRKFKCTYPKCGLAFFKMAEMQQHICVHHTKERTFVCEEDNCGKAFRSRHNLVVHMRLHTNEKPFKCSLCDYSCRQKNALNFHIERHHFDDGSKKVQKKSDKTNIPKQKCKTSEQQNVLVSPSGSESRGMSADCLSFGSSNQATTGSTEQVFDHHPSESSYSIISPVDNQSTQILYIPVSEHMTSASVHHMTSAHHITTAHHMTSAQHITSAHHMTSAGPPPGTNVTLATLTPLLSSGLVPTLSSRPQDIQMGSAPMDTLHVGECVVEYHGPL